MKYLKKKESVLFIRLNPFFPKMKYSNYISRLKSSIEKYKKSIELYRKNRPTIKLLGDISKTSSKITKLPDNTCTARKNNGSKCPSIRKKGEIYCHRHFKLLG
jgi:ArsR family metal-binding transcriptional regulator